MNSTDTFWGSWEKNNDTINLFIKSPEIFSYTDSNAIIKESYMPNKDSIVFKVNKYVKIFFNEDKIKSFPTDSVGFLKIKKISLNKFTVSTFGSTVSYKIKNSNSNYFEIITKHNLPPNISILKIDPIKEFFLKEYKLIPIIKDSVRNEFALKRKFPVRLRL